MADAYRVSATLRSNYHGVDTLEADSDHSHLNALPTFQT